MTAIRSALAAILALVASANSARADIVNSGFETGGFGPWVTAGDAAVVTSSIGASPTQGLFQAYLTTASRNGDNFNFSGTDAVSAAALRTFLGLPGGALPTAVEGSAVQQTFTLATGAVLSFDYKFLTTEGSMTDFAFVSLAGVTTFADTTAGPLTPSAVALDQGFGDPTLEAPWRTFSLTLAPGTYTLGIGVADEGDDFIPSALLIDNAQLAPVPPVTNAVPAPPAALVFALGLGCVATYRRRARRPFTPPG